MTISTLTLKERLEKIRKHYGLTQKQFGIVMGFDEKWANTSYQTAIKSKKLSSKAFYRLKNNYPELNANYLFDGSGGMFIEDSEEEGPDLYSISELVEYVKHIEKRLKRVEKDK